MNKKMMWLAVGLSLAIGTTPTFRLIPQPASVQLEPPMPASLPPAFGALPAHFEPGTAEGEYVARRAGLTMTLGEAGARVHLVRHASEATVGLMLEGAAPSTARPENLLPGVSNYFLGEDPRAWRTGVPHYARVRYEQIYPGIDLVYYGNEGTLEYDFLVEPGADPSRIRMRYRGASDVRLEPDGDLRIDVGSGALVHRKPVSYQRLPGGERREVPSRFELRDGIVTFALGEWDRGLPLVIDPVLTFATYFGGSNDNEEIHAIHVDAAGDIYVAGHTNSPDLPVTGGVYQTALGGQFDVFVSKFNSTGTALLYSTYLGGSSIDMLHLLRVDATGNTYLAGQTTSTNFPVSAGAPQATFGGTNDVFVAKLDAAGTALLYSTYLGGSGGEPASGMLGGLEVDAAGNAWIYSDTDSINFPVSAGAPQPTRGNPNGAQFDQDVTLTQINSAGTAFSFSTYHGGSGTESIGDFIDEGHLFGLDTNGNVWIAGTTASSDMPVTAGAFDTTHNGPVGGGDFFITRFDAASGARTMSTYLGGTGNDLAESFVVGTDGDVFIAGQATAGFPVTAGAADTTYNGGSSDIGIAKFGANVSELAYGTYLGGSQGESAHGLRIDAASGAAFVAGSTQSTNFPVTAGAADTTFNGGGNDGFIARLNPSGTAFTYVTVAGSSESDGVTLFEIDAAGSAYALLGDLVGDAFVSANGFAHAGNTDDYFVKLNAAGTTFLDASYLGGGGDDYSLAMHVDAQQNLYLGGITTSADFPATPGTVQPTKPAPGANDDMYLVKFATTPDGPVSQPGTLAFTTATFSAGESAGTANLTVSRNGGSSGAVSVTCAAGTQGGDTATAGADFTAASVTLNWADGDAANKTCAIAISGDSADEPDETFTATLSNAQGGATLGSPATATVTIVDDDAPPAAQPGTVQFAPATYSANENGGSVTITLTRTLGADGAIGVSVASGGGSASAGSDYTALSQSVSWADGDSASKTVTLVVLDDAADEPNETVTLTLAGATGGASLGVSSATVTIVDDDVMPPPPGPASQPSNLKGKYGGGSVDALLLLALAGVAALVWRKRMHRRGAIVPVLTATLASLSLSARAEEGWYAGLRAGVVETTQSARGIERALVDAGQNVQVTLDERELAFTALGGYRWNHGLALEVAYSRLGEFDVTVTGNTDDPQALLNETLGLLAQAGHAVSTSVAWNLRLSERIELTPRAGISYWRSTREVQSESGRLRARDDGVDLVAGITLSLKLDDAWSIGLGYEVWPLEERNDLRVWQMNLIRNMR